MACRCSTCATREDSAADTDMNVVMSGAGAFIEVQGTAEGAPFDRAVLDQLLDLGATGCAQLTAMQQAALAYVNDERPSGRAGDEQPQEACRAAAPRGR